MFQLDNCVLNVDHNNKLMEQAGRLPLSRQVKTSFFLISTFSIRTAFSQGRIIFYTFLSSGNIFKIVCLKNSVLESDYTGAKFYYQMPFISSSELCSRV